MRLLFTAFFLLPFIVLAQNKDKRNQSTLVQHTYVYSFNAETDSASVLEIARKIENLPGVYKVKARYKSEKGGGEFILFTKYTIIKGSEENHDPFHPDDLKKLLMENHLQPKDLRTIR